MGVISRGSRNLEQTVYIWTEQEVFISRKKIPVIFVVDMPYCQLVTRVLI